MKLEIIEHNRKYYIKRWFEERRWFGLHVRQYCKWLRNTSYYQVKSEYSCSSWSTLFNPNAYFFSKEDAQRYIELVIYEAHRIGDKFNTPIDSKVVWSNHEINTLDDFDRMSGLYREMLRLENEGEFEKANEVNKLLMELHGLVPQE